MEETYQQAISWLHSNTVLLDQQNDILQKQKEALINIRRQTEKQNENTQEQKQNDNARKRAQLDLEIDEITTSLRQTTHISNEKIDAMLNTVPGFVDRSLNKDDRVMDGLQKLIPRLDEDPGPISIDEVDLLCKQYVTLERQAMRLTLDHSYREALENSTLDTKSKNVNENDIIATAIELDELSCEIDGLVALNSEHHYRQHINRCINTAEQDATAERAKWSEYTACVLLYLTAKMDALDELVRHAHAHRAAMSAMHDEITKTTAIKTGDTAQTPSTPKASTPKGLKPLRLVQATLSSEQNATSQLLSLLGLGPQQQVSDKALEVALVAKLDKLRKAELETVRDLDTMQSESMTNQQEHTSALLQAVLGDQTPETAQLVNAQVSQQINSLAAKTETLSHKMRSLDMNAIAARIEAMT